MMMIDSIKGISRRVLLSVTLLTLHFSLFTGHAVAQGLPLIRNYTVAEYGGHNRCYDIETGEDGTVYVANFEGLLYYDRARWRMIYTPDISGWLQFLCPCEARSQRTTVDAPDRAR